MKTPATSLAYAGDEPDCSQTNTIVDTVLTLSAPWSLKNGEMLQEVQVAIRMSGPLNAPVVMLQGGISADRKAVTGDKSNPGWWEDVLGPLLPGVLSNFRLLGVDFLGGCGDTTGPVNWAESDSKFPAIDTADQARLLADVLDKLGIEQLDAFIGASYGGMIGLRFAQDHPHRLRRLMVIAGTHRPSLMAAGRRHVQRSILELVDEVADKQSVVALARSLAMTTYRSELEFEQRFSGPDGVQQLQNYLDHCGSKFARGFEHESYSCLSQSIDTHRVEPSRINTPVALIGFDTDAICPMRLVRELAVGLAGNFRINELHSRYGHDAFLLEKVAVRSQLGKFLRGELV